MEVVFKVNLLRHLDSLVQYCRHDVLQKAENRRHEGFYLHSVYYIKSNWRVLGLYAVKDLRKRWDRQSQAFNNVFRQAGRVEKIANMIQRLVSDLFKHFGSGFQLLIPSFF